MKRFISGLLCLIVAFSVAIPAKAASIPTLSDINGTEWYAKEVIEMVESGLVTGLPDKTFGATLSISSAEFVTIVARAVGAPIGAADGHWAGLTMQSAKEAGWFSDAEIVSSAYNESMSRQQAAMILVNAFRDKLTPVTSLPAIADRHLIVDRFIPYVEDAYRLGLFKGDVNGNFNPFGTLSRAEAAVLIYRATKSTETPAKDIYDVFKNTGWFSEAEPGLLVPSDTSIQGIRVITWESMVLIDMSEVYGGYSKESRAFVKQLLQLAYPTFYETAYRLTIDTMLERVFEKKTFEWNSSGSIRFMDTRMFSVDLISNGNKAVSIAIGLPNDYAIYELNAKTHPAFCGYLYRMGANGDGAAYSQRLIEEYDITPEERGEA